MSDNDRLRQLGLAALLAIVEERPADCREVVAAMGGPDERLKAMTLAGASVVTVLSAQSGKSPAELVGPLILVAARKAGRGG